MTTVLLVDDHPVVRSGLRAVLGLSNNVTIVGEAATGEEAITLSKHLHPDVVLCDLRLGEGIDGIEATAILRSLDPAPAVLILTTYDRDAEILGAIGQAASGNLFLAPDLATRVIRGMNNPLPKLTAREIDVLKLLATGSSNKQIARSLFVTEATVKSHLNSIFTKLDVDSRSRAIHVAQETGLI